MQKYYVIITCRNSENNIEEAILSISNQSIKPSYIIVVDDGSTDKTSHILSSLKEKLSNLYIITNPDLGYDIGRVVNNWNKAIQLTYDLGLEKTEFHMIATDDTIYEKDYAEKILKFLEINPNIVVSSGNYDNNKYEVPHGAGRFVNNKFFEKTQKFYPELIGYESFILYAAQYHGYGHAILNNARFEHTRKLGSDHNFRNWGQSMKALGFHPLFVLGRCMTYFIKDKPIGRRGPLIILYKYLTFRPKKEGYYSLYQEEIRNYVRSTQLKNLKKIVNKLNFDSLKDIEKLSHIIYKNFTLQKS